MKQGVLAVSLICMIFAHPLLVRPADRESQNSNILKLACSVVCPLSGEGRTESVEFIFNVDLVSGTVDGKPATITQDTISFTDQLADGKLKFVIHRYTGTCTVSLFNVPNLPDGWSNSGTCRSVTERQF